MHTKEMYKVQLFNKYFRNICNVGAAGWAQTKTEINPVSVFRVFDLLYIQIKPYESELSTALSECKAVARCATRKTDTAINRIKTSETHKLSIENTSGRKQKKNWCLQTVDTQETDAVINRIKTVGLANCAQRIYLIVNRIKTSETHKLCIENTSGRKRNKNRWGLQNCAVTRKHK